LQLFSCCQSGLLQSAPSNECIFCLLSHLIFFMGIDAGHFIAKLWS